MISKENKALEEARAIISGFMERWEAPTCVEQSDIAEAAKVWLKNHDANDDVEPYCNISLTSGDNGAVLTVFSFVPSFNKHNPHETHKLGAIIAEAVREWTQDENNFSHEFGSN